MIQSNTEVLAEVSITQYQYMSFAVFGTSCYTSLRGKIACDTYCYLLQYLLNVKLVYATTYCVTPCAPHMCKLRQIGVGTQHCLPDIISNDTILSN